MCLLEEINIIFIVTMEGLLIFHVQINFKAVSLNGLCGLLLDQKSSTSYIARRSQNVKRNMVTAGTLNCFEEF